MDATSEQIKSLGRLKKRSDFLCVQKTGKKWVAKGMVLEVAPNQAENLRYGLTVSKRVSKLAVTRNRVKRRLKSVACDVLPDYAHHHIDVVLIGRVEGETRAYQDLQNDLRWCLGKLGFHKKAA